MVDVVATLIGRTEAERSALAALIQGEDEIFTLQPGEEHDLAIHTKADLPRFRLLNARAKLAQATSERKSDRNMYMTIVVGIVLFIKTGLSWHDIGVMLAGFLH